VPLEPGQIVEHRYEVVRPLGEGAMGQVFEVRHVGLHSRHAMKVLDPALTGDPELRQRFLDEGRIQAQLSHPHIAAVTDIVTDPHPGLVMEYVEGQTLSERLVEAGGPLALDEIRAILEPVLRAVAAAHAAGVVHRDLKPSNILLERDAEGELRPVVVDFGIAKVLADASVSASHSTRTGTLLGTLQYMSPEQVRRADDIDERSDVFSLGAIVYEMATGRPAFAADSEYDIMHRIVQGAYEPPERLVDGLPDDLARCIECALALEPADRFESVSSMRRALAAVTGGGRPAARPRPRPAAAPPATPPSRTRKTVIDTPAAPEIPSKVSDLRAFEFRVRRPGRPAEAFVTSADEVFIGCSEVAGLQIDDPGAAEMHCAVSVDDYGRVLLLDLGSGKDTHLNGRWTATHILEPGDVIGIGDTEIEFQLRGA